MFNKNMEINEKDYNKLNSIQDDIKVNVNSMTNIRKGDNILGTSPGPFPTHDVKDPDVPLCSQVQFTTTSP
jgi:hypothetical protein